MEETFGRLQREFISVLPPVFDSNNPDIRWDQQIPILKCQRQMLRISVFALLLHLSRPLLQVDAQQIESVPQYKRHLTLTHRNHLVECAISQQDSVASLHDLMGGNQTKFFLLGFYTFEPAMLLAMHLLSIEDFQGLMARAQSPYETTNFWKSTPLLKAGSVVDIDVGSEKNCRTHINEALRRLIKLLREVSIIAEVGARKLQEVVSRLDRPSVGPCPHQDSPSTYSSPTLKGTVDDQDLSTNTAHEHYADAWFDLHLTPDAWHSNPSASIPPVTLDYF